jgi:protein TonB
MQVGQKALGQKALGQKARSPWPAKPIAGVRYAPLLPTNEGPSRWPNRRCIAASLLFHLALTIGIFMLPWADPPVDVVAVPVQTVLLDEDGSAGSAGGQAGGVVGGGQQNEVSQQADASQQNEVSQQSDTSQQTEISQQADASQQTEQSEAATQSADAEPALEAAPPTSPTPESDPPSEATAPPQPPGVSALAVPPPKPRPKPAARPRPKPANPAPQVTQRSADNPQPGPRVAQRSADTPQQAAPQPSLPPIPQRSPVVAQPPPAPMPGQVMASITPQPGAALSGTASAGPGGAAGVGLGPQGAGPGMFGTGQGPGDDYLEKLRRWLAKHKKYPEEAHKKKQEGSVLVGFVLARDGTVLEAHIERSSGFLLIDQAAIDMMRRASPVPPVPPSYTGERLAIAMPVRFTIGFFEKLF